MGSVAVAPRQLGAFAFLVGTWAGAGETQLPDGKTAPVSATWIGRYILNGTAIADEFHSTAPDGSPNLGISFRQYDTPSQSWTIEYLNVSYSFLRRQVNSQSGAVQISGPTVIVLSQSADAWSRERYHRESPDRFTYHIDLSTDAGHSWKSDQIQMHFQRRK